MYSLIITDLDGTAFPVGAPAVPSPAVVAAVTRARDNGLIITAATGRPLPAAVGPLTRLGVREPVVVNGGTRLVDPCTGDLLWGTRFTRTSLSALAPVLAPLDFPILIDDESHADARAASHRAGDLLALRPYALYLVNVGRDRAVELVRALTRVEGVALAITPYLQDPARAEIQITPAWGTKAAGTEQLLERLGISRDSAVAVGDSESDLPLFSAVGLSVAMGNAPRSIQCRADVVAPAVEDDGLAWVVDHLTRDPSGVTLRAAA